MKNEVCSILPDAASGRVLWKRWRLWREKRAIRSSRNLKFYARWRDLLSANTFHLRSQLCAENDIEINVIGFVLIVRWRIILLLDLRVEGNHRETRRFLSKLSIRSVFVFLSLSRLRQPLAIFLFSRFVGAHAERSITSHDPQVSIISSLPSSPVRQRRTRAGYFRRTITQIGRYLCGMRLRERLRSRPCTPVPLVRNQLRAEATLALMLAQSHASSPVAIFKGIFRESLEYLWRIPWNCTQKFRLTCRHACDCNCCP